ncbi:MAG: sugar transferase [Crocinitomicaceae bacterium]|nr:sugar transferase [Crocinitomicaceae bacterium]
MFLPQWRIGGANNKRFVIVGDQQEAERVHQLLLQTNQQISSVEFISAGNEREGSFFSGTFNQLDQVVEIHKIDEVIFCAKNISSSDIISSMLNLEGQNVDFKIAQPETSFLIGSNSIETKGDLYVMDLNRINKPSNQRNKRLLDLATAIKMIVLSPFLIWVFNNKRNFYSNMFGVLIGKLSMVGYAPVKHISTLKLPKIKRGILSAALQFNSSNPDDDAVARINLIYAKNHSLMMDMKIIWKNWKKLDS